MHRAKHRAFIPKFDARSPLGVGPVVNSFNGNGNGNGNGRGGGDGGGGGGGNGGGHGNGGGGSSNGGLGGNGNGGGSSSGSSGGGSSGGGSTPILSASPTSGGGTPAPTAPVFSSPASPNPAPSSSPSEKLGGGGGGGSNPSTSPSSAGDSANSVGNNSQTSPANVGPGSPSTTGALAASESAPVALATTFLSPSMDSLSSSNTFGIATPSSTISTAATVSSGKHLSGGGIAGITIVSLLFLLVLVFSAIRRRSIARRIELRRQWWFGHSIGRGHRSSVGSNGESLTSRSSARSSFATNFDQGLIFRLAPPARFPLGFVPDLPPVAEVRERHSSLISTGGSVARRESLNSMLSNGSDPDAQYLIVSTGQNNTEPLSPMSVRPFSPSESFSFPKPPAPSSAVNSAFTSGSLGGVSPQSSTTTLIHLNAPPPVFMADPPKAASTPLHPQTSTTSVALSSVALLPNPFADPAKPEFPGVEVIRRPFAPSLGDELAVYPGDRVCVSRIFDDGWALIEKLADAASDRHERGLIPVGCFCEIDQPLPTFLAEKRVSYGSDKIIGTAA